MLLAGMIDIHCHILPGIDDGAPDLATSLAMATIAADDGIDTVVATPHVGMAGGPSMPMIHEAVRSLNDALIEEGIALTVLAGAEVQSHMGVEEAGRFCLAGGSFFLLEFPHSHLPADCLDMVYTSVSKGLSPIIAHPERNRTLCAEPKKLVPLVEAGAQVQITAASLTGELGPDASACAHFLVRNAMVHFIGTDSHSPNFRKPILSRAVQRAARFLGKKDALALVHDNPLAILPVNANRN